MGIFNFFKSKEKRDVIQPLQYVQPYNGGLFFGLYDNGSSVTKKEE